MEILIDGHDLWSGYQTGIATYTRNLARAARTLGARTSLLVETQPITREDPLLAEIEFYDTRRPGASRFREASRLTRRFGSLISALSRSMRARQVPIPGQVVNTAFRERLRHFDHVFHAPHIFWAARQHFYLRGRRLRVRLPCKIDVAHWSGPIPIELVGAKNIYTLHDLIPLRLPFATLDDKRYHLKLVRHLAKVADHIATVSENSRDDILALTGCPEKKVSVTFQATDIDGGLTAGTVSRDPALASRLKQTFNLEVDRYFIFNSAIEPKKNVGRLLEAYLSADCDIPLVIVGPTGWKSEEELRLVNLRAVPRRLTRVKLLGYVRQPQLQDLLRGARALLFPSLYEGFGLPILEAMTLGTPVICSNTSSLPEVGGDAVFYVDPYRIDEIRGAVECLANDGARAAELRNRGLSQAQRFSHSAYATRLIDMYRTVLPDLAAPSGEAPVS